MDLVDAAATARRMVVPLGPHCGRMASFYLVLSRVFFSMLAVCRAIYPASGAMHANKRRHADRPVEQAPTDAVAVWDLLADEHAMAILSHCAPADLGRLIGVDQRLRRLALDERLWEGIYWAAFPPCEPHCIATLGASVASLDMEGLVNQALDLMFDPAETTTGCALPLPEPVSALGQFQDPAVPTCHHHWPEVIAVRGYRWAYAVATVDRPRRFGPHLDGSPPCLVGRSLSLGTLYRGDLVAKGRNAHVAHGYATADIVQVVPRDSIRDDELVAYSPSGQWAQGKLAGRAIAWRAVPHAGSRFMPHDPRSWCIGFYQGLWMDGRPHGAGILIAPDYAGPGPWSRCGAPSVVRCGLWDGGRFSPPARAWSVVARESHPNAGVGIVETSDGTQKSGIVRTADGKVAFVGSMRPWYPATGRLMARDGSVGYEGDVGTSHEGRRGRLFLSDGRTVILAGWTDKWSRGLPPEPKYNRGTPTVVVAYANGDQMRWYGNPASAVEFVYADGRVCQPPLGWDAIGCYSPRADAAGGPAMGLLIQDTPFAWPRGQGIAAACDLVHDLVFWPRLADPDDASLYAEFLDHMATRHGPAWVRCRAAVRLLWGLADTPAAAASP
ncbi:hypothetical protein pclt_cds_619 [Pandoravirus celtis]|uniref:F-box domain containing protein n=1 Tax=Pandoravirus celtis TaxID=2568002 RepID=A0A4D6EIG1_9VIRU|nr:hypothetical protein pclt_cds_619 [Pandoravirus celtis]